MSQCNILLAFVTGMTYCYDLSFGTLCRDELPNLEYLTMCIKESLRIHPPVPNISRQITKPITFPNGLTAPAGQYTVNITHLSTKERGRGWRWHPENWEESTMFVRNTCDFRDVTMDARNVEQSKTMFTYYRLVFTDKHRPQHFSIQR